MAQDTLKPSKNSAFQLHHVEFYKNNMPFLSINNDSVRAKIQPNTLKYYSSSIFSPDENDIIGSVRISLSTQNIDDQLALRIFQLTIASIFFVLITSILLSWLLDKIVIQPLERLSNKIQILLSQRFNQKISTSSWDEIGNLFHNINHLRVRMKKNQEDDLSNLQHNLDRITTHQHTVATNNKTNTILIVDDDELIQMYLKILLEKNGMKTVSAANGIWALKLILETDIDLVLLDLSMPGITGFDVLESLNTDIYHKNIPVIVISSNQEKESVINALNKGAVDYVMKPFNKDILIARIKTHLKVSLREKDLETIISERIASLKTEIKSENRKR
ncbi:MAG: response regulator [Gammaproteobacteria bacterium]